LFIKLIRDTRKALKPHEVWILIKLYMDMPGLPPDCRDACTLIMDWCIVAAQASGPDKDSYLAFGLAMLAAAVAGRNPKLLVVSGPSPNSLIPDLGTSSSGLVHLQLN
jgi:hypothetical protein